MLKSLIVPKSLMPTRKRASVLTTGAIVSFSLTLLAAGSAVLAGIVPLAGASFGERIDIAALLMFTPVCALILAVISEVVGVIFEGPLPQPAQPVPSPWLASDGED